MVRKFKKVTMKETTEALADNIWRVADNPVYLERSAHVFYGMVYILEMRATYKDGGTHFEVYMDRKPSEDKNRRGGLFYSLKEAVAFINTHAEEAWDSNVEFFGEEQVLARKR